MFFFAETELAFHQNFRHNDLHTPQMPSCAFLREIVSQRLQLRRACTNAVSNMRREQTTRMSHESREILIAAFRPRGGRLMNVSRLLPRHRWFIVGSPTTGGQGRQDLPNIRLHRLKLFHPRKLHCIEVARPQARNHTSHSLDHLLKGVPLLCRRREPTRTR